MATKKSPGAALAAMRQTFAGGRPKKLRACPACGAKLGAREMREHGPQCPKRGVEATNKRGA